MLTLLVFISIQCLAAETTIPVIVKDTSAVFWQSVYMGSEAAAKKYHVKAPLLGMTSEMDIQGQISIVENATATNPPAIVLAPTDRSALVSIVEKTNKKIPVVLVDSAADTDQYASYVATNNTQAGVLAAQTMAEIMKKKFGAAKGKVAIVTGQIGATTMDQRCQGFVKEMQEHYPDVKIITNPPRDANSNTVTALGIMTDLLTSVPDLRGIFATSEFTSMAGGQALTESPRKDEVVLIGTDNNPQVIDFVRQGVISAVLLQDPYRMGYVAMENAVKASRGEKVDRHVDTGVKVVTSANVDMPEIKALWDLSSKK